MYLYAAFAGLIIASGSISSSQPARYDFQAALEDRAEDLEQTYQELLQAGYTAKQIYLRSEGVYYTPIESLELLDSKTRIKVISSYQDKNQLLFFDVEDIDELGAW